MTKVGAAEELVVGDMRIVALSDGDMRFPTRWLFPETPESVWDGYRERFPEAFDARGFFTNIGVFLVRSGARSVLVDTGLGPHDGGGGGDPAATLDQRDRALGGVPGWRAQHADGPELMDDLRRKGIRPDEVDTVFLTHLHGDHIGWNLTQRKEQWLPTFPKARYLLQQADWNEFTNPKFLDAGHRDRAERTYLPLLDLGVLDLIEGDHEVAPGLTAIHTPGHTSGHMSMLIASGADRALIIGDVLGSPMHASEPDRHYSPDTDQAQARNTRHKLLDMAEGQDMVVLGSHMTRPGWGRLIRWQGRRYWRAL